MHLTQPSHSLSMYKLQCTHPLAAANSYQYSKINRNVPDSYFGRLSGFLGLAGSGMRQYPDPAGYLLRHQYEGIMKTFSNNDSLVTILNSLPTSWLCLWYLIGANRLVMLASVQSTSIVKKYTFKISSWTSYSFNFPNKFNEPEWD